MLTDIVRNNGLKGKNDTETKKNVKVFVENNHRQYRIDDRTVVNNMLSYAEMYNNLQSREYADSKISEIREKRKDAIAEKWKNGVYLIKPDIINGKKIDYQRERLIELRTDLLYNEYIDNLDTEWRNPVNIMKLTNPYYYSMMLENKSDAVIGLSIDEAIKNMREQVK